MQILVHLTKYLLFFRKYCPGCSLNWSAATGGSGHYADSTQHSLEHRNYTKALDYLPTGLVIEAPDQPDCDSKPLCSAKSEVRSNVANRWPRALIFATIVSRIWIAVSKSGSDRPICKILWCSASCICSNPRAFKVCFAYSNKSNSVWDWSGITSFMIDCDSDLVKVC